MLTPDQIQPLLRIGESSTIEFKANTPAPAVLARILSSFANADGGTVIVGVREPNAILGTDVERFNKLLRVSLEKLQGDIQVEHQIIDLEAKSIGIIQISAAKIPVASPEGYFRRVGTRDEPLAVQQLIERMSAAPNSLTAIESMSRTISAQTIEIAKLRESFEKANSWKRKVPYIVLGAVASAIIKLVFTSLGFVDS